MTTISVDATWRMSQVVFTTPYDAPWYVVGNGEMLLRDPAKPDQPFGVMPGAMVTRTLDTVMEETVDIDGKSIPFSLALDAMKAFLEKWRVEDAAKPPVVLSVPTAEPPTEVMAVRDPIVTVPVPPPKPEYIKG